LIFDPAVSALRVLIDSKGAINPGHCIFQIRPANILGIAVQISLN
jgi:hypothetical protein